MPGGRSVPCVDGGGRTSTLVRRRRVGTGSHRGNWRPFRWPPGPGPRRPTEFLAWEGASSRIDPAAGPGDWGLSVRGTAPVGTLEGRPVAHVTGSPPAGGEGVSGGRR